MESYFKLVFGILAENRKYSNEEKGMNIDQSEMYYISVDLARQALETNVKIFSNFGIIFRISYNF